MTISRKCKRTCLISGITAVVLFATAIFLWIVAPFCVDDPIPVLKKRTPVRVFQDRTGKEVFFERTCNGEWRFHTDLSHIPEKTIQIILAVEDADFYYHSGVNYKAMCRAFWQNLIHFRIVSGASTISMQLASMAYPNTGKRRNLFTKFIQAARARKMEKLHSKQEILEYYMNYIPFGGNIYGIETAARYYFGCDASDLSIQETALLCGLPQRPAAYRPDKHPQQALKRRKRVLLMLERQGILEPGQAEILAKERPRFRDFRYTAYFVRLSKISESIHYFHRAAREAKFSYLVKTAFHPDVQAMTENTLKACISSHSGPRDAAAIVIENRTGAVIAYVGTVDFYSPSAGQVDGCSVIRTAGSILKPFLYWEAVRGGILTCDTIMDDTPLRYSGYMPGNNSGVFHGKITAQYALTQSLNTPAIRLLAQMGLPRISRSFHQLGLLKSPEKTVKENGLSMILGTSGHSLFQIARAYTIFTGTPQKATFLADESTIPRSPPGNAAYMISLMLSSASRLPLSHFTAAWKTGTSSGCRDAWCVAYTPEYTVCVWFGNKNGASVPGMSGLNTAAPCASVILSSLYREHIPDAFPNAADNEIFQSAELCTKTGLSASIFCKEKTNGTVVSGIPLKKCGICVRPTVQNKKGDFRILFPKSGNYLRKNNKGVKLFLQTENGNHVVWFLDEKFLGEVNPKTYILFPPGNHKLSAVSMGDENAPVSTITLSVE